MAMDGSPDMLLGFVLDSVPYYVRWHPDEWALDWVVATSSGQWAFESPDECRAAWQSWEPDEVESPHAADLDVVIAWLAGRSLAMPTEQVLNAWNWAGDVARGVGLPWHDRGRLTDRVHSKLTFAAVPFLIKQEGYSPRWSSREFATARQVAVDAVTLVRRAMLRYSLAAAQSPQPLRSAANLRPRGRGARSRVGLLGTASAVVR